jgi:ribA/ribD-fused uncharacterized protein
MLFKDELDFLSNFYPCALQWRGTFWPTVEHAYQAAKCAHPEDEEPIRKAPSPNIAKGMGRRVLVRPDWNKIKVDIMMDLVWIKFRYCKDRTDSILLKDLLLETGDIPLEEGNYWHDNFWGQCYCKKCVNIHGQNALGIILEEIRRELTND